MRTRRRGFLAALALAGAVATAPVCAASAPDTPDGGSLAADEATVQAVMAATQQAGFAAIGERAGDLQAILDRAPRPFAPWDERPDGIYVRAVTPEACLLRLVEAAAASKASKDRRTVSCLSNPYAQAALMLGSYDDEIRQPAQALAVLDRGLALAPDYAPLIIERGAALMELRRFEEMLQNDHDGLNRAIMASPVERAALLRGQGFALTELGRLDEAEAAYRESLRIDSTHGNAARELVYIAGLRKGAPATASQITSGVDPTPH